MLVIDADLQDDFFVIPSGLEVSLGRRVTRDLLKQATQQGLDFCFRSFRTGRLGHLGCGERPRHDLPSFDLGDTAWMCFLNRSRAARGLLVRT
jgi:hypothetical protein